MSPRTTAGLAALATVLIGGAASADTESRLQVAAPPVLQAATSPTRSQAAIVSVSAGAAVIPSRTPGAYGRLSSEFLAVLDRDRPSFAWGFWGGWEAFGAARVWGLAVPLVVFAGFKSPKVLAAVGGGANLFGLGSVDEKFGGGVIQPRAHARIAFHLGKVLLTSTADVQYDWGWGHPTQVVLMTGVSLGFVLDEQHARR